MVSPPRLGKPFDWGAAPKTKKPGSAPCGERVTKCFHLNTSCSYPLLCFLEHASDQPLGCREAAQSNFMGCFLQPARWLVVERSSDAFVDDNRDDPTRTTVQQLLFVWTFLRTR